MAPFYHGRNELFVKVLKDMEPYIGSIVLVGGWLPFVYSRYLWKNNDISKVLGTQDIDFAVDGDYNYKGKLIQDVFDGKDSYRQERVYDLEPAPVYYFIHEGNNNMRLDFISHEFADPSRLRRITGNKIETAAMDFTNIMLDKNNTMIISVNEGQNDIKVRVPHPAVYMFVKGITCPEREQKQSVYKLKKDLWSIYFILENLPKADKPEFYKVLKSLKEKNADYYGIFISNISGYFQNPGSYGPEAVRELLNVNKGFIEKRAHIVVNEFLKDIQLY